MSDKHDDKEKIIKINVDGNGPDHVKEVIAGTYTVSEFKAKIGVPAEKVLEQKIHGKFEPLVDTDSITIEHHEDFISHVKYGGSSCH